MDLYKKTTNSDGSESHSGLLPGLIVYVLFVFTLTGFVGITVLGIQIILYFLALL